jgi:hypothetical protein
VTDLNIPTLVIPAAKPGDFVIGLPTLLVDGDVVPWPTMGDWRLTFEDEGAATLTLTLPVRVEVAS